MAGTDTEVVGSHLLGVHAAYHLYGGVRGELIGLQFDFEPAGRVSPRLVGQALLLVPSELQQEADMGVFGQIVVEDMAVGRWIEPLIGRRVRNVTACPWSADTQRATLTLGFEDCHGMIVSWEGDNWDLDAY